MHATPPTVGQRLLALLLIALPLASLADVDDALPLEPSRLLEFDVAEGTWMSVDVHPDGQTVLFDLLGDIYSVPIDGGQAVPVRSGMAFDAQPVYSPDGEQIAFVSDASGNENLWVANADGTEPRQLSDKTDMTRFSSPAWSADGESVYVSERRGRHAPYSMRRYHLLGGAGVAVRANDGDDGETPDGHMLGAVASADGRYLYSARKSTAAATLYAIPAWHIIRRNLDTGDTQPVVTSLAGAYRPAISSDGKRLFYGMRMDGETGLRVRNLVTGEDRWVAYPAQRDNADSQFNRDLLPGYAVTPDGEALIAAIDGKLRRVDIESGVVQDIPFNARVSLQIGPSLIRQFPKESGPVRARLIQDPALSPDNRQIVFSAFARLYVAELESGRVRQLTDGSVPAYQPNWSPDGRFIVYVSWTAAGAGQVMRISARGGRPRQLSTHAAFFSDPAVASDGETVFALRSSNEERMRLQEEVTPRRFADLVRIPASGGTATVMTHAGVGAGGPYVTNDAGRVFFTTPDGVVSVLASAADNQGVDRRLHVRVEGLHPWTNAGRPHPLAEIRLSPDGRWLLARAANQLYLVTVPQGTGTTPLIKLTESQQWPRVKVSRFGADYFGWADNGNTVTWSLGNTWFSEPLASVVRRMQGETAAGEAGKVEETAIVVEIPRDEPRGKLLLRGATALTMTSDAPLANADILVEAGRIVAVGSRGSIEVPADAELMDLDGLYVLPGFVDTHAHWYEIRHGVLDTRNWSFLSNLAFGVTAGLDVQAMDRDMFAYQDLLDAGLMTGPRAWSVGQGIFANNEVKSREQADDLVRRYTDYYRTTNVKSYMIGNRQQRQWIVQASLANGAVPTTEGNEDLKLDLTHAIDGFAGNEHQLPVVPIFEDVVQLYARTGIGYTPTLMITSDAGTMAEDWFFVEQPPHDDPKVQRFMPHFVIDARTSPAEWVRPEERMLPRVSESATRILRAGGRIGVGSHAEFQGVAYHWEMQALAAGGMTPGEVLRAATVLGSQIIGRGNDVGTIEAGKYADLVVLNSNPLGDIRNTRDIRYVMKNGRLYDDDTLDELWPRQKQMPSLWHRELMPGTDH